MKHCQRAKRGVPAIRSGKDNERRNFPTILYRIPKDFLGKGHGIYLVELASLHTMRHERETH